MTYTYYLREYEKERKKDSALTIRKFCDDHAVNHADFSNFRFKKYGFGLVVDPVTAVQIHRALDEAIGMSKEVQYVRLAELRRFNSMQRVKYFNNIRRKNQSIQDELFD